MGTKPKYVKPHVNFFHRHNVKFLKFSCLLYKYLKQLKTPTQIKLDNDILGVITQRFIENIHSLLMCA